MSKKLHGYLIFRYKSKNTGYYCHQGLQFSDAQEIAKKLSKCDYPKARIEDNETGFFEEYENGIKTSWSSVNIK